MKHPIRSTAKNPVYTIVAVRTLEASLLALLCHCIWGWPLVGPHALGLFLTPALCAYFVFVFVAPWTWGLPIVARVPSKSNSVVLTFDDGPSPETTPQILDILGAANVRAVFFVLGQAVDHHPGLLRRIAAEGHQIAVHGCRHRPFVLLSPRQIRAEVEGTRAAIARACPDLGLTKWVRPPHGFKSPALIWTAWRANWRLAAWSLDGRDYRETDPVRVAETVLTGLRPGAIVLLHDGPAQAMTVAALPLILDGLRGRGWACLPLPP